MTQLREDHVLSEVAPLLRLAKSTDLPEGGVEEQQQILCKVNCAVNEQTF